MSLSTALIKSERGSARLKFLIVVVISVAIIYAGYLYVPVAFQAYEFKDVMQTKVDAAAALGHDAGWVTDQLVRNEADYGVPPDAVITPASREGRLEVRVQFKRPISFPGYTYQYEFDHTVISGTFLIVK
jgi:hypothetical protein